MAQLLISDANILIDMHCGGLLERVFELPFQFGVPDVLFHEELSAAYPFLPGLGLQLLDLSPDGIATAVTLARRYAASGCSRNDLLALALALQEGVPLLSGDLKLRQACEAEGHNVHGTLWLMDQFHEKGLLSSAEVQQAYEGMRSGGSRLPWVEVDRQVKRMK
jgi:hypothetical protein